MDIITEADALNPNIIPEKLSLFTPYHFKDPIANACTKSIKQIIENQKLINVSNYKTVMFICYKYDFFQRL